MKKQRYGWPRIFVFPAQRTVLVRRSGIAFRLALFLAVCFATARAAGEHAAALFPVHAVPATDSVTPPEDIEISKSAVALALRFPETAAAQLRFATNCWMAAETLEFDLYLTPRTPPDVKLLFFLIDADHNWFQKTFALPQTTNGWRRMRVDLAATAGGWIPQGHYGAWHHRVRMRPAELGLRLLADTAYEGTAVLDNFRARPRTAAPAAPVIQHVRALTPEPVVYERYELALDLPDRYDNPFDPDEIDLTATVTGPDGRTNTVAGFYYQAYFRRRGEPVDRLFPQGKPHWRIRYTPTAPGPHRLNLRAEDRFGTAQAGPIDFTAALPQRAGFVRVSKDDPRFFEFDDGSALFPIGHNIRSSFDERMNTRFPWAIRHDEGPAVYKRYFSKMQEHGENLTEIWMAPWSFGIEWSPISPGYHGRGHYNLIHSWQLDRIIEKAERHGIYLHLTIHNHGKFSTHWDPEWSTNPHNVALGGYLENPEDYFSDARAMTDFENLMRYIIARWGYSPAIFSWKLWNELDLTGSQRERVNHRRPAVVEWHRRMGRWINANDPYRHLVSTHFCGDYTHQNPAIIELPELDIALVDAYHSNPDPLHIVEVMRRTADFNERFGKPVIITEFGGSPYAATLAHLDVALHAALWSSVAVPLGGAPMLWWWGVIDEENHYPKFKALSRFMAGEDRRNAAAQLRNVIVRDRERGETAGGFNALCFTDGRNGLGWLADTVNIGRQDAVAASNLVLRLNKMEQGIFAVEFWETGGGTIVNRTRAQSRNQRLDIETPVFKGDLAFKFRLLDD